MLSVMYHPGLQLTFFFHLLSVVSTINPRFYPCDDTTGSNGGLYLDCKHRGLTSIPKVVSLAVISFNLNENLIRQVKSEDFLGIPNLQQLSLMWNCLPGHLKALKLPSCNVIIDHDAFVNLKNLTSLYLAGNSLKAIPLLPQHLEVLGLEFNNIFRIERPLGTPFLKQLLLAKNCYYANPCNESFFIDPKVFQDLPELQNLTLGFNNLTFIPAQFPPSLKSLDLKENKISEVKEDSFANLMKLNLLNLEWNCQRCDHAAQPCFPCPKNASLRLHHKAFFAQNNSLINLSLRGNSLHFLPKNLFTHLNRLRILDLSDNFLAYSIRNGTFYEELTHVVSLNLLYNYEPLNIFSELILSPSISKMRSLRTLQLSGLFFHQLSNRSLEPLIKLSNLERIDLRMNFISSCNVTAFNKLKALEKVGLSQNMLTFNPYYTEQFTKAPTLDRYQRDDILQIQEFSAFIPKVQMSSADCTETDCSKLYSVWYFQRCLCYKRLFFDLSQNNIPWLNASTFHGMEEAVCLDLSYNYMSQTLNGQQFLTFTKLTYLNMAYNRIDLYFNNAFQELKNTLKVLDLSNNEFHFLMRGIGHHFTFILNLISLEVLSLANNKIGLRISNTLNSTSLKYLFFAGNRLDIMWDTRENQYIRFFQGLTNLTYLDISDNQLRSCSPEVMRNLPQSIRLLRMDSNLLNYFPWSSISVLSNLCYLNLSGNYLSQLPDSIIYFGKLCSLDLSHNRLNSIPELFFSQATGLKELMLNHNQLKILMLKVLPPPLQKGSTICTTPDSEQRNNSCKLTLHANPFTCSCATSWFADFLRTSPINIPHLTTDVHCGFPETQTGVAVISIDPRSCQEIFGSVAFFCTGLLVIVVTAFFLLSHLYGWDLWYCFQILWAGHKGYSPIHGVNNVKNQYDAFIVFDPRNKAVSDWVYNEMVFYLENRGKWQIRLCLEERDWVPGLSCIENLHNAVYTSRKTVFVLNNYGGYSLVNGIMKQAFFLVQQRLLDEKVDVAVLVLLDPLFPKLKYIQLRKRLCKNSVLSWPKNPRAQPLFWNNLHIALASDNVRSYDKKVTESFLSHEFL